MPVAEITAAYGTYLASPPDSLVRLMSSVSADVKRPVGKVTAAVPPADALTLTVTVPDALRSSWSSRATSPDTSMSFLS